MIYKKTVKKVNKAHIILRNCEAELSELFGHVIHLSVYHVHGIKPKTMSQEKFEQLNELKILASKFELIAGLNSGDLAGKKKTRKISDVRSMFMNYALKNYTSVLIGMSVNRAHSTVLAGKKKFAQVIIYPDYQKKYEEITSQIKV